MLASPPPIPNAFRRNKHIPAYILGYISQFIINQLIHITDHDIYEFKSYSIYLYFTKDSGLDEYLTSGQDTRSSPLNRFHELDSLRKSFWNACSLASKHHWILKGNVASSFPCSNNEGDHVYRLKKFDLFTSFEKYFTF